MTDCAGSRNESDSVETLGKKMDYTGIYSRPIDEISQKLKGLLPEESNAIDLAALELKSIYCAFCKSGFMLNPIEAVTEVADWTKPELRRINLRLFSKLLLSGVNELGHQHGRPWTPLPSSEKKAFLQVLRFAEQLGAYFVAGSVNAKESFQH